MSEDVRWKQRFNNFMRALHELGEAVALREERALSRLEEKGLIQSFEIVHELAWNLVKDYLEAVAGTIGLMGSKDATREAFKRGLLEDGQEWMDMIKARKLTSHVYDEATARAIVDATCQHFYPCFLTLAKRFTLLNEQAQ